MSCFASDAKNIVVTAIKQSEDGTEPIIRFCEMNGEQEEVSLALFESTVQTTVKHNEIRTFRADGTECNLIEWEI